MTSFKVLFAKSAHKEFKSCPNKTQDKIIEALQMVSTNPFSDLLQIKKLKGAPSLYRIRIGDWRIVYEIRKDAQTIVVIKIGHRKDIYRFI